MRKIAVFAVALLLAAIGIVALGIVAHQGFLMLSEVIEVVILGVLVIVTGFYAYSTYRIQRATVDQAEATKEQAEISRQAMEIALTTMKSADVPIVTLGRPGTSGTVIGPGRIKQASPARTSARVQH